MATKRTVFVSLQGEGNSKNLRLRDSSGGDEVNKLTTKVDVSDTVHWVVDPHPPNGASPIHSIENVYGNDPDNVSLLTADPTEIGGGVWEGTVVSTSPGKGKQQKYNIDYKRTPGDDTQTCDPKLQMN